MNSFSTAPGFLGSLRQPCCCRTGPVGHNRSGKPRASFAPRTRCGRACARRPTSENSNSKTLNGIQGQCRRRHSVSPGFQKPTGVRSFLCPLRPSARSRLDSGRRPLRQPRALRGLATTVATTCTTCGSVAIPIVSLRFASGGGPVTDGTADSPGQAKRRGRRDNGSPPAETREVQRTVWQRYPIHPPTQSAGHRGYGWAPRSSSRCCSPARNRGAPTVGGPHPPRCAVLADG